MIGEPGSEKPALLSFAMALVPLLHSRNMLPNHVILTEGKDLVASTKIEILPSCVGQDDTLTETVVP
jgi:hypothetical protein